MYFSKITPLRPPFLLFLGIMCFALMRCTDSGNAGTVPSSAKDSTQQATQSQKVEDLSTCNHPEWADTAVISTCYESMTCVPAGAASLTLKNAFRFRVRSGCSDANYDFHSGPIRYTVYRLTTLTTSNMQFGKMATFTCSSPQMVIGSSQLNNNTWYYVKMNEFASDPVPNQYTFPRNAPTPIGMFRTKAYKGKPCGDV